MDTYTILEKKQTNWYSHGDVYQLNSVIFPLKSAVIQTSDCICGFNVLTVGPLSFWHSSGSQDCNTESAASATHGNLLERQVLRLRPLGHEVYPLNQKFCVWGQRSVF